jgi:hypothetical protein
MHCHIGAAAIIVLIIVAALLFGVYGWATVIWPTIVLAVAAAIYLAIRQQQRQRARRVHRSLELRRNIAKLEAEQGIPLMTEGPCPYCGHQLIAGARFCSYCKTPTQRIALVCERCGTRNASDAVWCGACGAELPAAVEETVPRKRNGFMSGVVMDMFEWPPYK